MALVGTEYPKPIGVIGSLKRTYATPRAEYLPCDGAKYDPADYPALSALFEITTNVLPASITDLFYTTRFLDISSATANHTTNPVCTRFNADGTRMWLVQSVNDAGKVNEYDLSIAWDVTTAVKNTASFTVASTLERYVSGVEFNATFTRMWVVGTNSDQIYEYDLPTPGTIAGAIIRTGIALPTGTGSPTAIRLNKDGTRMWVSDISVNGTINEFDLPTKDTVEGAVAVRSFVCDYYTARNPVEFVFTVDESRLFVLSGADRCIFEFDLPTPGTIAGMTHNGIKSYNLGSSANGGEYSPRGMEYSPEAGRLWITGTNEYRVIEYDLKAEVGGTTFSVPEITTTPPTYIKAF